MAMNQRYLQRFGEPPPFRDSIARAALRDDPDAAYGELPLGDNEGQRLFEQPDTKPLMTKDSMVAADDPYANYGAESGNDAGARQFIQPQYGSSTKPNLPAPVNDPYLNYDPEAPIRGERKLFQPPTMPSRAAKSIEQIEGEPEIGPGRLSQPSEELPTAPPPENPVRRYQRELDELKAPERGPVSKWAKLAAVALGAGQGYYNAANPNARPIDASEAVQNLTFGRKYLDAMGEYQRKRKEAVENVKLAGEVEQVETNRAYRESLAANSRRADEDRDEAQRLKNFQFSIGMARDGGKTLPADSPVTTGAIRMPNPLDKTGKTVVDIVPKNESRKITDKDIADALGMDVGDSVSDTLYQEGVKRVMEFRLRKLEIDSKKPPVEQENINHWVALAADPNTPPEQKAIAEAKIKKYAATQQAVRVSVNAANPNLAPSKPVERGSKEYSVARDMASGDLTFSQFTKLFSRSTDANKRLAIYDAAREINPSFNPASFEAGYGFAKSPKVRAQIASLNNVDKGVDDLLKFSDKAGRSGFTILNKAILPGGVALGNKNFTNFHTAQVAFADELSGALGYGSATDMAKQMSLDLTNPNFSPENFKAAINDVVVPFIARKRSSLTEQMGPYGNNQVTTENSGNAGPGRSGGGPTTHFEINGQPYDIPNEKVAAFKVAKGLK